MARSTLDEGLKSPNLPVTGIRGVGQISVSSHAYNVRLGLCATFPLSAAVAIRHLAIDAVQIVTPSLLAGQLALDVFPEQIKILPSVLGRHVRNSTSLVPFSILSANGCLIESAFIDLACLKRYSNYRPKHVNHKGHGRFLTGACRALRGNE